MALSGCEEKQRTSPEPSEPWEKGQDGAATELAEAQVPYQVLPGQLLHFSLPGKRATPQGAIGGLTGELQVNLRSLEFVTGELHFDLNQLRIAPEESKKSSKRKRKSKKPERPVPPPAEWTTLAHRWLGLGSQVPERDKNARATFIIESAKTLSHPSAHVGALRKTERKGTSEVRQVYVTAVGRLKMRGLSVKRQLPLLVRFHYREKATRSAIPHVIEVSLRHKVRLPLAEYEIRPRDERGNLVTEDLVLLGKEVGSVARISGTIELQTDSTAPPASAP